MKLTALALSLLSTLGTGCALAPQEPLMATADLPDCYASNYDAQRDLFTIKNVVREPVNQQCILSVGPRGIAGPAPRLTAGSYTVFIANGGGGGAGGTRQGANGGGGGGGGGAGAKETQSTIHLAEGLYKLTVGAGGAGGNACVVAPYYLGGGPGWGGSPTNIVRAGSGELVAGVPGAESYQRLSRAQNDKASGRMDGHGGSGSGKTSGGYGGSATPSHGMPALAEAGQSRRTTGTTGSGGIPGGNEDLQSAGGGGGGTTRGDGGDGGGESPGHANSAPERGSLGSGGGGGEGGRFECDAGARGGHGFIALRRI